jgi:N-acetylneuraminate epimerase
MTAFAAASVNAADRYPDLPIPLKNSAGAKVGNVIYAGLGSAGSAWYSLDVAAANAQWQRLADFPGASRDQANAAVVDGQVYVFGGAGKPAADKTTILFDEVYRYDPATNQWAKLPTRSPLGLLGAAAVSLDGRRVLFFGGVNKAIFDGFFVDTASAADAAQKDKIGAAYFGGRPQDYLFTADVLSYTPATNGWQSLGKVPHAPTVGAGVAVKGNEVTLVNGELKPGLRSYEVKRATVNGADVKWTPVANLSPGKSHPVQDGVAGAFAGYSQGTLLVAGGANFPGSWGQFRQGRNYAHEGLTKTWQSDIFALVNGQWRVAGQLPRALGYGLSFEVDDGLLLVGGEEQGGKPTASVLKLKWDGDAVRISGN